MPRKEEGFSLIEVLFAAGILGFLVISIMGLFIAGGKGVKQGKTYTDAVSAGDKIMNQINSIARQRVYLIFGADETTTGTYTWSYDKTAGTVTYTGGSSFMSSVYSTLNPGDQEVIDSIMNAIAHMYDGVITVTISPLTDIGNGGPANPTFFDAPALKVLVVLDWREQQSDFSMRFETIR